MSKKVAVVMGSEGPGLKPETIAACDYTVTVPMTSPSSASLIWTSLQ